MGRVRIPLLTAVAFLSLAFAFRLAFGLSSEFFFEDETQIFLLGLKYHATGQWPFFGPDVVWTRSEIPGALQSLLVGIPLAIVPAPESPFVFLNVVSMAALAAFAWYTCEQLPWLPRWLVWGWLLTAPWTLHFSTHIINPSYILPAAIAFFVAFFEAVPTFSLGFVSPPAAHFIMGAALTWVMQIHLSWPLLIPYAVVAWFSRRGDGVRHLLVNGAAFAAGALVPGLLLIPTLLRYGIHAGSGGTAENVHLHGVNPWVIVTTIARLFSFASLEIHRFIATDDPKRIEFFEHHMWLLPIAAVVWAAGILQPLWMLLEWCRAGTRWPRLAGWSRWQMLRGLIAGSVLLVYASYWFVVEPPQAHAFYVLAPLAFMFAAYCWTLVDSSRSRVVAGSVLALNVLFQAALASSRAADISLYKNRAVVATAIQLKAPEMFAHRRPFAVDGGPYSLQDSQRPYDVQRDIDVVSSTHWIGLGRSLRWQVTVRNASDRVAFRDLLYVTKYLDATGRTVDERQEFIKDILQPGTVVTLKVNDGFMHAGFTNATFEIVAGEALLPIPGALTSWPADTRGPQLATVFNSAHSEQSRR